LIDISRNHRGWDLSTGHPVRLFPEGERIPETVRFACTREKNQNYHADDKK